MNSTHDHGHAAEAQIQSAAQLKLHGGFWVKPLCRAIGRIYFGRPRVFGATSLPRGAALLASNHRSGAIDGMVLAGVERRWTFMVGANLARHPLMRHLVAGLVVERVAEQASLSHAEQARRRADNRRALDDAAAFVAAGGALCIFPEGTSALGPALLPLHPGVAAVYLKQRALGGQAPLVPISIHYAHGAIFRGLVEVTIGTPLELQIDEASAPAEQHRFVLERLREALAAITVNVRSMHEQQAVEGLATLATAGTRLGHGPVCRALAHGLAQGDAAAVRLVESWRALKAEAQARDLRLLAGTPLFLQAGLPSSALGAGLLAPLVATAALVNLPILVIANAVARRQADAENVVALWRALAALPAALCWWAVIAALLFASVGGLMALLTLTLLALLTLLGLRAWHPWRVAAIELANAMLAPDLGPTVRALREETLTWFASR